MDEPSPNPETRLHPEEAVSSGDTQPGGQTRPGPADAGGDFAAFVDRIRREIEGGTVAPSGGTDSTPRPAGPSGPVLVAGYDILGELGRGGMGVVYAARQQALNRAVALKMLPDGAAGGATERARFLAEAAAVAAIDHPNVVRVFECGESGGRPYFAMELLPGGTLATRIRAEGRLAPAAAAELVRKVAAGVQAAHDQGIVHRDLKPANVLLDAAGEPKVTDFGLAKRGGQDLTHTGAFLGTPAYMSPEQAAGRTKFAGPAADVYALGVILYECLTGAVPFTGEDAWSVIRQIAADEPESVSKHVPGTPRDLELICRKCLQKDPADRYPSAAALADDLGRFLRREPISVRPPTLFVQLRLWARQNFGSAGWTVAGGGLAGLLAGGYALLELLGTKLYRLEPVYEHLPRAPKPWLSTGPVSEVALAGVEAAMMLTLVVVIFGTTALVRPRNRSADVAAGLVTGLVAAMTFFVTGFGWWSVYSRAVLPAGDELALASGPDERIVARYPDLAALPEAERRRVLADKVQYDVAVAIPEGIAIGVALSVVLCVPVSLLLVGCAAPLLRAHGPLKAAPRYLEITLPTVIFCGYAFLVAQRLLLHGTPPQHPGCYALLLTLTLLAVLAARRDWNVWLRLALQAAWLAYYAYTNYQALYEF